MSTRVGLALAHDAVRAVALRQNRIVWAAEAPMAEGQPLEAIIRCLLAEAPVSPLPRPILSAAVGPHAAQVKLVTGLPDITDADTLAAIIREGVGSFFLKNGVPLITTGARAERAGAALAAALDLPSVEAIRKACRARGWRLGFIAPAAVVLPLALEDQCFAWADGRLVLEITCSERALGSVRTRLAGATDSVKPPTQPTPALATLGVRAVRFADAYGAAVLETGEPLALNPLTGGPWSGAEARRRLILPGIVLLMGIASLVLSPLAASWAAKRAEARLGEVRPDQSQAMASALSQLDRVTNMLEDLRGFAASRTSATVLLGEMTRALPDGSMLATFELDEVRGVQVVVLTPRPGAVLSALERLPGIGSAELVGPVRRESVAGRELQQVAVRLQTKASPPPARSRRGRP
ncbi:MAG: hypothetical protein ACREKS_15935 [Candidatus Rokuibacteriota bacterium]